MESVFSTFVDFSMRRLRRPYLENGILHQPLLQDAEKCEGKNPFYAASFYSRFCFSWLNPLLSLGYAKTLDKSDIPPLDQADGAAMACNTFMAIWSEEKKLGRSISTALIRCHMKYFIWTGICALLHTLSLSLSPLLLFLFIDFASRTVHFKYEGYVLVFSVFLCKLTEAISQRHWYFGTRQIGLRIRSALIAAVSCKVLALSTTARQRRSEGEVVSYISVDAYQLGELPWWLHQVWTVPLQIIIALVILFSLVGWAATPGLVVILVTAAIQTPLARYQQVFQTNLMKSQDERLRATNTILSNIKLVKLLGLELRFKSLLHSLRETEFIWLEKLKGIWVYGGIMFWMSPIVTASIVFGSCVILGNPLTATIVFTVLSTFRVIQEPVRNVPDVLTALIQANVALRRINDFLIEEESNPSTTRNINKQTDHFAIAIEKGAFSWDANVDNPTLKNINLLVSEGELVAVCGPVGSGKSTLIQSILGEVPRCSGTLSLKGSIAYVGQTAWIQSGTVRDNILFGRPMQKMQYEMTIAACALSDDLSSFSHGDLTEIGQRGLNLSGGQKQRIQLARALYSNADVYLLDDPLSAVDAETAAILFKKFILEALSKKTTILVTHQVDFLSRANKILVMEMGGVRQVGEYHELVVQNTMFEQLVNAHNDTMKHVQYADNHHICTGVHNSGIQKDEIEFRNSKLSQLTREEEMGTSGLAMKSYIDYINSSRGCHLIFLAVMAQAVFVAGQFLASYWLATQVSIVKASLLVGVYAAISLLSAGIVHVRSMSYVYLGLKASKTFFTSLINSLFSAPMSVFDATPIGRILTRASLDMSILDIEIPVCIAFVVAGALDLIGMLVAIAVVTWPILIIGVPMLSIMAWLQKYYLKSARELMRINSISKAPILNYASEMLSGSTTIRAYEKREEFYRNGVQLIDLDSAVHFHAFSCYEWVAFRIEVLNTAVVSAAALLLVLLPSHKTPAGFAGLSLTYAMSLNACQIFLAQWYSNMEKYIISVERIQQYTSLPKEAPANVKNSNLSSNWPVAGKIELENLQIEYRKGSPLVLKGITCTFHEHHKIGIVGRTGSGKSTLLGALFRLVEPIQGRIVVDGINISSIGLHDLRSRLGIIPQEPFLFRGTVRSNLDPFEQHSDQEIWETLWKCQLGEAMKNSLSGLDSTVTDEGGNWSVGQRQLFCLARVLLKHTQILVLDEATASIDSATDSTIQKIIREQFSNCTVITVAHRIPTIIDSDMILGLKNGYMVEYDTPNRLLEDQNSLFSTLVTEYWSNRK